MALAGAAPPPPGLVIPPRRAGSGSSEGGGATGGDAPCSFGALAGRGLGEDPLELFAGRLGGVLLPARGRWRFGLGRAHGLVRDRGGSLDRLRGGRLDGLARALVLSVPETNGGRLPGTKGGGIEQARRVLRRDGPARGRFGLLVRRGLVEDRRLLERGAFEDEGRVGGCRRFRGLGRGRRLALGRRGSFGLLLLQGDGDLRRLAHAAGQGLADGHAQFGLERRTGELVGGFDDERAAHREHRPGQAHPCRLLTGQCRRVGQFGGHRRPDCRQILVGHLRHPLLRCLEQVVSRSSDAAPGRLRYRRSAPSHRLCPARPSKFSTGYPQAFSCPVYMRPL